MASDTRARALWRAATDAPVLAGTVCAAVGVQIAYPLVHGSGRRWLTLVIVALFAAVSLLHAGRTRGPRTAFVVLVVTAGVGFAAEVLGVATGVPFGSYAYSDDLGPRVLGVPLVVGLAWTMLAWPALLVTRRLVTGALARVLVGAWALASADLFLDPQLVASGAWRWADPHPHLPGVDTVPLGNYVGWLPVAAIMIALLDRCVPDGPDALAVGTYLWLWVSWSMAQAVWLGLPASAGWGALGMGLIGVPVVAGLLRPARSLSRDAPAAVAAAGSRRPRSDA